MKKQIKLMPDYGCHPIWSSEVPLNNLPVESLSLSRTTMVRLNEWAQKYDETLNDDYPPASGFATAEDAAEFELEGLLLWRQLSRELCAEYEVGYYSYALGTLFSHPREANIWRNIVALLAPQNQTAAYNQAVGLASS